MSEHTKGQVKYRGCETLAVVETLGGREADPIAHCGGPNALGNAQRISACLNACEEIPTEDLETGAKLWEICAKSNGYQVQLAAANSELTAARALIQQQDSLLGKKACATKECAELLAARALLREVLAFGLYEQGATDDMDPEGVELTARARSYLDACDTLEGKPNAG